MGNAGIVFDHVHLVSEDPESAGLWYEDKLGGKVVGSGQTGGSLTVRVAFEGATIIIRGQRANEQLSTKPGMQWGTDHFGFSMSGISILIVTISKARGSSLRWTLLISRPTFALRLSKRRTMSA